MSVQRVYVGEPGGENLDVARENTNQDTAGQARFKPGDTVTIPSELAERLDASWATEGKAKKQLSERESDDTSESEESDDTSEPEGGDES
jgi:hypothetical protein